MLDFLILTNNGLCPVSPFILAMTVNPVFHSTPYHTEYSSPSPTTTSPSHRCIRCCRRTQANQNSALLDSHTTSTHTKQHAATQTPPTTLVYRGLSKPGEKVHPLSNGELKEIERKVLKSCRGATLKYDAGEGRCCSQAQSRKIDLERLG